MALIPNPNELIRKVDMVLANTDEVLGRVDGTVEDVSTTLTKTDEKLGTVDVTLAEATTVLADVKGLLGELRAEMALLQQVPAMVERLDEVHQAVTKLARAKAR